jgi:thiol-disulfide isomerase/thioredoxin
MAYAQGGGRTGTPARRATAAVGTALVAALVLAACGSATGPQSAGADAADAVASALASGSAPGAAAGATATTSTAPAPTTSDSSTSESDRTPESLRFAGTTVDGTDFDAAELAGTPVIMWFWAPWCTVCRTEAKEIRKVAEEYEGRLTFLGVAGRGPLDDMKQFVDDTDIATITHVADETGEVWNKFGITAQPSFVFVAADGRAQVFVGGLYAPDLRRIADEIIAA